jgi:hypothetical protein
MSDNVLDMKPAAQWTPDCQGKWQENRGANRNRD